MKLVACILCLVAIVAASLFNLAKFVEWLLLISILYMAIRLRLLDAFGTKQRKKRPARLVNRIFLLPSPKTVPQIEHRAKTVDEILAEEPIPQEDESPTVEMPVVQGQLPAQVPQRHEDNEATPLPRKETAGFICHVAVGKGIVYNKSEIVFEETHSAYPTFALYNDGTLRLVDNMFHSSHSETYFDKRYVSYVYDFIGRPQGDSFRLSQELEHPRVFKDGNDIILRNKGKVTIE